MKPATRPRMIQAMMDTEAVPFRRRMFPPRVHGVCLVPAVPASVVEREPLRGMGADECLEVVGEVLRRHVERVRLRASSHAYGLAHVHGVAPVTPARGEDG